LFLVRQTDNTTLAVTILENDLRCTSEASDMTCNSFLNQVTLFRFPNDQSKDEFCLKKLKEIFVFCRKSIFAFLHLLIRLVAMSNFNQQHGWYEYLEINAVAIE